MTAAAAAKPALSSVKKAVAAKPPAPPAPPPPPSKVESNVTLWSFTQPNGGKLAEAAWPAVVNGTLAATTGDPAEEAAGPRRLSAFLGLGANLRGLAAAIEPIVNKGALDPKDAPKDATDLKLTQNELEKALAVYLGLPIPPLRPTEWKVGRRVILPIEVEIVPPAAPTWKVGRAQMREWARLIKPEEEVGLQLTVRLPVEPLPATTEAGHRPLELKAQVATRLGTLTKPVAKPEEVAALGAEVHANVLVNPFEGIFYQIELMRQLRRDRPELELPVTLAILSGFSAHQAAVTGWTMGGNALFRRLWDALRRKGDGVPAADKPAVAGARALLAGALGLAANGTAAWYSPTERGPSVPPVDLFLAPAQLLRKSPNGKDVYLTVVYGRLMAAGVRDNTGKYYGPAALGSMDLVDFVGDDPAFLGPAPSSTLLQCWDLVKKIAPNEGKLDGLRLADAGIVSIGIQQWTIAADDELTVVLYQFMRMAPDHFDLFFGIRGMQLRVWGLADTTEPTPDKIDEANPYLRPRSRPDTPETWRSAYASKPAGDWGDAGTGPADDGVPSRVKLVWLKYSAPGGPVETPQPIRSGTAHRWALFGGVENAAKQVIFDPLWGGISRLASQTSRELCTAQLQTAVFRFQRLWNQVNGMYPTTDAPGGKQYPFRRLVSSQFFVAAVIDAHINVPGLVAADLDTAFRNTYARKPYTLVGTEADDHFLMRMAINFVLVRRVYKRNKDSRDHNIVVLHDKPVIPATRDKPARDPGLNATPGSFTGWPAP
ncbi:hypothetical protein DPM19_28445 [Actinomadura craniellae]|uniref:Uncharacterized protein n=1 Tax=Actinomadura craniellae TaxID=2231787 RepID=A0A365GYJ7_9ACTN|nr:hypothetical protein [Actinomadura craniellae]RAY11897.1 hypothetical protein DPM19_28445 [Actinomadura craniellae]